MMRHLRLKIASMFRLRTLLLMERTQKVILSATRSILIMSGIRVLSELTAAENGGLWATII